MSTYAIYSISQETVLKSGVPYPNVDENAPVMGLDPDLLLLRQTEAPHPPYDPELQQLTVSNVLDLENGEYRREWSLVDLPPKPDWPAFNSVLLTNPTFTSYQQTVGMPVAGAVLDAYALVAKDGVAAFTLVFNLFCQLGSVTVEHRGEWADIAAGLNLPSDFVEVIRG